MKKVFTALFLVVFTLVFATTATAEPQLNRRNVWNAKQFFKHGMEIDETATFNNAVTITGVLTEATGGVTATEIADVVRYMQLPIASFLVVEQLAAGASMENVDSTTIPGLELDDLLPAVVWADGEATPIQITFRIPSDYSSGGAFKVFATESNSSTPNQVDFDVYINQDGLAADASATGQTPVALDGVTSTGTEITLSVATDFASLAAGDWVTLRVWRDDTADGTGDLEIKGIAFYYTATQ